MILDNKKGVSMKRHTCIICGKKRYERVMRNVFQQSWTCSLEKCLFHADVLTVKKILLLSKELSVIKTLSNYI